MLLVADVAHQHHGNSFETFHKKNIMAKKKRVRKPDELSLAQLQELMDNKASELSELRAKRAEV